MCEVIEPAGYLVDKLASCQLYRGTVTGMCRSAIFSNTSDKCCMHCALQRAQPALGWVAWSYDRNPSMHDSKF